MKRCTRLLPLSFLALVFGCESEPKADQIVPIEQVPQPALEAARKALPGYNFDTIYKLKVDGEDAFELRGKDKRGKIREVEVSAAGKVIEIE